MPSTLLTGANAFLAAHIIDALVSAGHHVTRTVRRAKARDGILALYPEWRAHLDIVVVEDITDETSWDSVFKGTVFDHVVHVAAPLLDNPRNTDYDRDFLKRSVEGNLALLRSAQNHAPSLKSMVVTGSINASTTGQPDELLSVGPITNSTWLPITRDQAREMNSAFISYCSAKKEGELAIWDFVQNNSPKFTITILLPAIILGPPIEPLEGGVKGLHFSSNLIYSLINGTHKTIPQTPFPSYVDARDLANAHVKSLMEPKVANKRLNIGGSALTFTALTHSLAKLPGLKGRLPAESGEDLKVVPANIIADEGNKALSMTFRSFDETMVDTARRILELEKQ